MKVNARLRPSRYGVADSRSNRASRCIAFLCLTAAACSGSAGIGAVSCGIPGGAPPPAAQHTPIGQLTPNDNDPPVPDPANPSELDAKTFGGNAMTYYGRWTHKYEIGAQKGAAAVLLIHETGPAGYGFNVVQGKTGEQFDLVTPDKNMGRAAIEGWITLDQGRQLLKMGGQDFDALKKQAATRDFKPLSLGVSASMTIHNKLRTIDSQNVVAKLESSDPARKDEYVVYTAHWDHCGIAAPVDG